MGSSCLDTPKVSGCKRVPLPPARTIPLRCVMPEPCKQKDLAVCPYQAMVSMAVWRMQNHVAGYDVSALAIPLPNAKQQVPALLSFLQSLKPLFSFTYNHGC